MPGQQLNWSSQSLRTSFVKHFQPNISSLKGQLYAYNTTMLCMCRCPNAAADRFSQMWHKYHVTGDHFNAVIFDFRQSVTMTWGKCEIVRWERDQCHSFYDPEIMCGNSVTKIRFEVFLWNVKQRHGKTWDFSIVSHFITTNKNRRGWYVKLGMKLCRNIQIIYRTLLISQKLMRVPLI
jgi:hypothetical protein